MLNGAGVFRAHTVIEHPYHRLLFGCLNPQPILRLNAHLLLHIDAPVRLISWQPGSRVCIALLLVSRPIYSEQIIGVIGELNALLLRQFLSASLPRVRQGYHMIDLHRARGVFSASKVDAHPRIRILQGAAEHCAGACSWFNRHLVQIAAQNIVAGIAPVTVGVCPGMPELIPRIPGFGCAALDR